MCCSCALRFRPVIHWGLTRMAKSCTMHALHGNGPATMGNATAREATKVDLISASFDVSIPPLKSPSPTSFVAALPLQQGVSLLATMKAGGLRCPLPTRASRRSAGGRFVSDGQGKPLGHQGAFASHYDPSPPLLPRRRTSSL